MPDLAAQHNYASDSDEKYDDEDNFDDNDYENDRPAPRQNQIPVTITHPVRVAKKPQRYDTKLGNVGLNQAEPNYYAIIIDAYILEMDSHEAESHSTSINT